MALKAAHLLNLLLAGTLAGNEFGTLVAVHPAFSELSDADHIRAEQEITGRYGAIMPFWMSLVIVSCLPVLVLIRDRRSSEFRLTLAGMGCFVAMLAITLLGNVPINNSILELSPETDSGEFARLRERWDQLHTARVLLDIAGFVLLCLGALRRSRR